MKSETLVKKLLIHFNKKICTFKTLNLKIKILRNGKVKSFEPYASMGEF